ncbi:MAG: archease [Ignavibacteria bacterium]|nr:archease [Ignavibacteria bacterium]
MPSNDYRIFEHPADIGISVRGRSWEEAFAKAARGLFSLIVDCTTVESNERKEVRLEGSDREQLFVRWLSELLYFYDGEKFVVSDVEVQTATSSTLAATVTGERWDVAKHSAKLDVKAITYHELKFVEHPDGIVEITFVVDI